MKVAFVLESYPPHIGGSESRAYNLVKRLPKSWEIHVITPCFDYAKKEEVRENVFVHRFGAYHSFSYFKNGSRPLSLSLDISQRALFTLKKLGSFDACVYSEWNLLTFALTHAFVSSPKLVDWCEVLAGRIAGLAGVLEALFEKNLAQRATHHIAVNEKVKELLKNVHKVDSKRISVVQNGVDERFIASSFPKKQSGRLLYVGRLTPHKGVHSLLMVFSRLRKTHPYATLHIVGAGDPSYTLSLKKLAVEGVEFLGVLSESELIEEYKSAQLLVLPSEREGSSLVSLEAMANYTPVVTIDAPLNLSKSDTVIHGFNGLVVKPSNLLDALQAVLSDETLWKSLSQNANLYAKERSWSKCAKKLEEVLKSV